MATKKRRRKKTGFYLRPLESIVKFKKKKKIVTSPLNDVRDGKYRGKYILERQKSNIHTRENKEFKKFVYTLMVNGFAPANIM